MSAKKDFTGPFAPLCVKYVELKQAAGYDFKQQSRLLRCFDDFCKAYKIENYSITEDIAIAWSKQRPNESEVYRNSRIGVMQRFSQFLCMQGYPSYFLPSLPRAHSNHTPHIFTYDELHRIFYRLDDMQTTSATPFRNLVMPVLMRMLYGCGLRVSEALNLTVKDVDLENGILYIRHAKNDKERLVPMSASLTEKCRTFSEKAHLNSKDTTPFFYNKSYGKYSVSSVHKFFRGIMWDVGIPYLGRNKGPRVHDLRHTFACHNIQKWAEAGEPIQSNLVILSKYLGHANVSATQWYLHMSAQEFPMIREICERELGGMYAPFKDVYDYVEEEYE